MRRPAYAVLKLDTQFENAGDALIIRELVKLSAPHAKTIVFLSNAPPEFTSLVAPKDGVTNGTISERGGAAALVFFLLKKRLMGARCYYFLIPGGLNGEKSLRGFLAGVVSTAILAALSVAGVKVCQVGVSLERIGPRHAKLLRWRSRFMHRFLVRDPISFSYGRRLGVEVQDTIPDLAFNLPRSESAGALDIAFSFRTDKDPSSEQPFRDLVELVTTRAGPSVTFRFIAQVARDAKFMEDLANSTRLRFPGRVYFTDCHRSIDDAFFEYRKCRSVVSNRLHALLLGIHAGATPVAVINSELDQKISGLFSEIDLAEQIVHLEDVARVELDALLTNKVSMGGDQARDLSAKFSEIFSEKEI